MPSLSDLLADPDAVLDVIAEINYYSPLSVESIEWVSQLGWMDPPNGPVGYFIPPLLETGLQVSQHINPLELSEAFGSYSQIILINDATDDDYPGRYDGWHRNSIDNRAIRLYLVGILASGVRVELSDVITTPIFSLRGIDNPEVGESRCTLNVRDDSHSLDSPLQPVTYSPPCLSFPGSVLGCVDFGDHYDQTGTFSAAGWVWLEDPSAYGQYVFFKDGGTSGYNLAIGGTPEIAIRAQTPPLTTAAGGLLHARQWYFVSFNIDVAAGTREIGIDGVSVASSTGVTGSPTPNSISFLYGRTLRGKLHDWHIWNVSQTVAAMFLNARLAGSPTAANQVAWFPTDEGVGPTTHDRDSGSSLTGTIGTGVLWDVASWHWSSLVGAFRPWVLGTVPRVPVTWVDPANQIGELSYGGHGIVTEVQSNHNALSSAIWTQNKSNGTFQVISGPLSGTYSATVTANNFWNAALQVTSTSTILPSSAINSVNNSCTLCIQYTPSKVHSLAFYVIMGWQTSALAGSIILRFVSTGGGNRLGAFCVNDAATVYTLTTTRNLVEGRVYSLVLVRNTTTNLLSIYVDGEFASSIAISGTFTTTRTQFGIGCRPDSPSGTQAEGRYDEPLIFNRALTLAEIKLLHLLPASGGESGLVYGWHFDDATGSSAASMIGGTALSLTNATWTGGRSAPADLARTCYYLAGYDSASLDQESWLECLNSCPCDCGWFVGQGESALAITRIVLGGLGFVPYQSSTIIYIKRFIGVTGVADVDYTALETVQQGPIEAEAHDPAVWEWVILYAHNNVKLDAANIAGSLATSDPDRYQYGQTDDRKTVKSDYSIKYLASGLPGRYPNAISKTRQTALINQRDAETEGLRVLELHKHGSDTKSVALFLLAGRYPILHEAGFDVEEIELDQSTWVVIGIEAEDDNTQAVIWRPAVQVYETGRATEEGDVRVTDDGSIRIVD